MGSEQISILFLGAAVHAHHGRFGVDLALQKPISHTEIPIQETSRCQTFTKGHRGQCSTAYTSKS